MFHIYLPATEWNFLFEYFHTKHLKAVPLVWNGAFQKSLQRTVSVCLCRPNINPWVPKIDYIWCTVRC